MNIVITGGAGFLGQRLAKALLSTRSDMFLTLVDVMEPTVPQMAAPAGAGALSPSAQATASGAGHAPASDTATAAPAAAGAPAAGHAPATVAQRVRCLKRDLRDASTLADIITPDTDAVFHLAAIVSSQAEAEPDLGYEINFLVTRNLLEAIRHTCPSIRLIFSSSLAVFGGQLPAIIRDDTALTPQSTYGTQKAMCELLINDYTRKGFVDGIALRLPTVCIRPGKPNRAASSFVSSIMREPLSGEKATLPVSPDLRLWLSSPDTVVQNFIHALSMPSLPRTDWHVINLPGFSISVQQMLAALATLRGKAILDLVEHRFDKGIDDIVASWPAAFDDASAIGLGFVRDASFADVIRQFIDKDLPAT